ncbi:MAG: hypothetical protein LBP53_02630 [Candidatus Peribacteria bacterium]|nr:hypothetical protein [Candidatus Peribacteria bacterium]
MYFMQNFEEKITAVQIKSYSKFFSMVFINPTTNSHSDPAGLRGEKPDIKIIFHLDSSLRLVQNDCVMNSSSIPYLVNRGIVRI